MMNEPVSRSASIGPAIGNDGQQGDAEGVLEQQRSFAQPLGAGGGDEFGLGGGQHAFAQDARDFADKIRTQGDGRQNHVPRRFPERDGQPF